MQKRIAEKLKEAVNAESTSKDYAVHFYREEAETKGLFDFDTMLLDKLILPGTKVFDAMMARGRHVLHFARKRQDVSGNDRNPHMVELVKADLKREKLKATLYNLDVTNLSEIRDNTFDCVLCMYNSLGCIPKAVNRAKAMQEFTRIVKPGGQVIVHAYNRNSQLWTISDLWWTFRDHFWRSQGLEPGDMLYYHSKLLGHSFIHYFGLNEFRNVFLNSGLKVTKEYYLSRSQKSLISGPLKAVRADGFIFVGRK